MDWWKSGGAILCNGTRRRDFTKWTGASLSVSLIAAPSGTFNPEFSIFQSPVKTVKRKNKLSLSHGLSQRDKTLHVVNWSVWTDFLYRIRRVSLAEPLAHRVMEWPLMSGREVQRECYSGPLDFKQSHNLSLLQNLSSDLTFPISVFLAVFSSSVLILDLIKFTSFKFNQPY